MKLFRVSLLIYVLLPMHVIAQNVRIIEQFNYHYDTIKSLDERIYIPESKPKILLPAYQYLQEVEMKGLFYESDGLKVKAYMAYPKKDGNFPVIIYNRGGNREFGAINEFKMAFILARVASWGYIVIASQYRGNDGGEGMEEFGGKDVNDILNLIPLINNLPNARAGKIGMYGWSRGGMMSLLSLMRTDQIKAVALGGALSDLRMMNDSRGGEMEKFVYSELMPDYYKHKDSLLNDRSAITMVDRICKTTPMLLMHGVNFTRDFNQKLMSRRLCVTGIWILVLI